jgi:hypothetical protein
VKIRGYDLTMTQRGWVCDVCYTVTTARQFTDEEHVARGGGRWLLTAMISGYLKAKVEAKHLRAMPGERERIGWVQ